jgi:S1-C subfamily serine protease
MTNSILKHRFLLVVVLLTPFLQGRAQTPSAPAQLGWLDHWRLATFSFGQKAKTQDGKDFYQVIGTGILIATDQTHLYIVTAKHVFDEPEKNWHPSELRLRFAWEEKQSVFDDLGSDLSLLDATGKPKWHASEDGADIAAIPIEVADLHAPVLPHAISVNDIAKEQDVFEGATILALGYPGIVGNQYLVRAISRGGIIAWLNPDGPFEKPLIVDANIYPGNSGGPVLKMPTGVDKQGNFIIGGGGGARLLGIVSQAPGQQQTMTFQVPGPLGTPQPLTLTQSFPLGGTGIVEPASKIPALLASFYSPHPQS